MDQQQYHNKVDMPFRFFLLESLSGRAVSTSDIKRLVLADYPSKKISRMRLNQILLSMKNNNYISRRRMDDDKRCYEYTITKKGEKRKVYYKQIIDG